MRPPVRRVELALVAALALAGVGVAHVLEYRLLEPDRHRRLELLAGTGHQYLPSALGAVSFLACLAVAVVFLTAFRRGATTGGLPTTSRHDWARVLPLAQALSFVGLEVAERVAAGSSLADLGPVLILGLPLQILVGAVAAALLGLLDRAGEKLGRSVAGSRAPAGARHAAHWWPSSTDRPPCHIAVRRAPARAPPPASLPPEHTRTGSRPARGGRRTRDRGDPMRVSYARVGAAVSGTVLLALLMAGPALAHERRSDGDVQFVVGWAVEPTYTGFLNGVSVRLADAAGPIADVGDGLKVEVLSGDQKVGPLAVEGVFGSPGEYEAPLVPTRPGPYTFHFVGTVKGQTIDQSFTSSDTTFDSPKSAADIEFPAKDPSRAELATLVDRQTPRLTSAASTADDAKSAAGTATILAVVGLVLGLVGVVLGAVAWRSKARADA